MRRGSCFLDFFPQGLELVGHRRPGAKCRTPLTVLATDSGLTASGQEKRKIHPHQCGAKYPPAARPAQCTRLLCGAVRRAVEFRRGEMACC